MAKIAEYLKQILSARYGRDVRQSIHDAISAINDESTECWATVEKVPETLAIAAVKDRVSGKDITLEMSSDFILTDFNASGNTEQDTTSGKNLLNPRANLSEQNLNGITYTPVFDDKGLLQYINVNGTATEAVSYQINGLFKNLKGGETYTVSGSPGTVWFYLTEFDSEGNSVTTNSIDTGNGVNVTIPDAYNYAWVGMLVRKGEVCNNLKVYPMIRLATIADGTYEPFTNGASPNPDYPQEIKSVVLSEIRTCRKNLLNYSALLYGGISSEDGYTLLSSASILYSPYFTKVKRGESYIFNVSQGARIYKYDANKKFIESVIVNGAFVADCDYIRYQSSYFTEESQLELGKVSSDYEPYTESVVTLSNPITLNGLNGVQDYIDAKRGVLVQKIGNYTYDGTEVWSMNENTIPYFSCPALTNFGYKDDNTINFMCDYFRSITVNQRYQDNTFFFNAASRPVFTTSSFETLNEWKEWLTSNNVTVVYELAEPIETPLPEADVEALKNIRTFRGATHVFTDSEVKPDLEVEYVIDTKLYIDAKFKELS